MPLIELVLEYDGTPYAGWQRQADQPSVQATLEAVLSEITREPIDALRVAVAGRTDRGVHARGQRVTFHTQDTREPRRLAPAINHRLPPSIRVHRARAMPETFDVRRDASAKWYRYTVQLGLHRSVLYQSRAWHIGQRFDFARAQAAAQTLVGEHDFEAFRSAHCDAEHARRRIDVAVWSVTDLLPVGSLLHLDLVGNAFCRHMCRILAGTLVEMASGHLPAGAIERALASKQRKDAGQTAPAAGLTLVDVAYDDERRGWPVPYAAAGVGA